MKTTTSLSPSLKRLRKLHFREAMIGLELEPSDDASLAFVSSLAKGIGIPEKSFIHVIPRHRWIFPSRARFEERQVARDPGERKAVLRKMQEEVRSFFGPTRNGHLHYFVQEGSPLEQIVQTARERKSDLIVLGRRSGGPDHVILGKNIVRSVSANLLVVPENASPEIRRVVVPVDFSEHSVRALKSALRIKKSFPDMVIHAVNVFQKPTLITLHMEMTPERFEEEMRDSQRKQFDDFIATHFPSFQEEIHSVFIQRNTPDIAGEILRKARSVGADMIIMGAKGQSLLKSLLLGSTTESLLDRDEDLPVLVVR